MFFDLRLFDFEYYAVLRINSIEEAFVCKDCPSIS